ncbi:MAG: carbohydrate-binding domain-containing protein [Firmicutes bacterium]|nr:carbohydrate-binding domain-containing protein [Bacillota bacterium]
MKNKNIRKIAVIALAAVMSLSAGAAVYAGSSAQDNAPGLGGWSQSGSSGYASEPSEIVTSELTSNSAEALTADTANAETIVMSDENNSVKISKSGTYIVTGTCADGNLAVKKGTTGVVLILKDLDLTSSVGATVSLNKGTEVKVIIEGNVTLTDAEDIADEETDDFDGAALKAKTGSSVVLTGTGTLTVNGSCKNGIKVSDLEEDDIADGYTNASFVIDGRDLTIDITAEGDGINSGTDLTIKSGNITVSSGDDGIKADYILTIGEEGTEGPVINVKKAGEAIEGATINIYSGNITVNSTDDGINAANKDLTDYTYSLNIMGGTINITAGADGIDSNGNINIIGGLTTIVRSASNGGEGGLDYEGSCYVKEGCLVNPYGTTMDSGKGGMGGNRGWGGQNAQNGGRPGWGGQNDSESGATPEAPDQNGGMPGIPGQNGNIPEPPEGEIRDENGNIIERNDGQRPEWGGQRGEKGQRGGEQPPENSGEAPQDQGNDQNSTEDAEELNFFQKLINFIIGLFKK